MITPTTAAGAAGSAFGTGRTGIGRNEFLKLLVTQLRNQDPLSPLQPHEFAAQLAQFSSVEQLTQLNEAMGQQLQDGQLSLMMSKTAFSAALIGRGVVAAGHQVVVPATGRGHIRVEVGGTGGHAVLTLRDAAGRDVATRDLGSLPPGRQTLELPGDLPAGTYSYELKVTGSKDAAVPVQTYTTGIVDGVSFRDGAIVLKIGAIEIMVDDLVEIESALGAGPNSAPPQTPASHPTFARGRVSHSPLLKEDLFS
jgi:flagellar basal-body rod modification protein FlgD